MKPLSHHTMPHAMHCPGNHVRCGRHVIRSRAGLVQELQHTSATLAAMETSETTLKAANTQYKDQRGTIKSSHQLLRTMRVNSLKDSLKLYAALAFFTLVIGLHWLPPHALLCASSHYQQPAEPQDVWDRPDPGQQHCRNAVLGPAAV